MASGHFLFVWGGRAQEKRNTSSHKKKNPRVKNKIIKERKKIKVQ